MYGAIIPSVSFWRQLSMPAPSSKHLSRSASTILPEYTTTQSSLSLMESFLDKITQALSSIPVIHAIRRQLLGTVVLVLEWILRTRFRINERRDLLRFLIGQTAGIEIRHRVTNDSRQRVNPRCSCAVIPGVGSPQWTGFFVTDCDALAILAMAVRAMLHKKRFAAARIEFFNRNHVRRRNDVLASPRRVFPDLRAAREPRNVCGKGKDFRRRG